MVDAVPIPHQSCSNLILESTAASRRLMLKRWHDNVDVYSHLRITLERTTTIQYRIRQVAGLRGSKAEVQPQQDMRKLIRLHLHA
jgi:hypothetical protein